MQEMGEFLERLGKQIGRMERRYGRGGAGGRIHEHFSEHFNAHFGDDPGTDAEETGPETESHDLDFGEHPELRLKVNLASVYLRQVEAGGRPRVSARGRDLSNVEVAKAEDGSVEVKANQSLFGRSQRLYIYVPAGTRVRGGVDLGSISADGLTDTELDLKTDAGRLRMRDCHGRLRVNSNAGKVEVQSCSGALDAAANAGKVQVRDFKGTITARADAGSIRCSGLRLEPGEHTLEASMGSIDVALVPDVPVRIETRANLGSVHNQVGSGSADAPAHLSLRTDLGSIRVRFDEGAPTPLRRVTFTDERHNGLGTATATASRPAKVQSIPLSGEESTEPTADTDADEETLRILGMVERHEISAGEGASLLAAIRR